ncbi:60S ribosomal protein L27-3 [Striga hermonthica]|uniref:60S ribosomal protein L27 n=1 Tax=Striga hermonthica TaxID=68872 RepID=A0A9N7N243_STRHE|nr:60S ribosomal protein L27-3 [Striga hermonthica]
MVKFIKPNKAVILLQGRHVGHKAVVLRNFDDGTCDRPYGSCLSASFAKYPTKVVRWDSARKVAACKEIKAQFEERFKNGKNYWFFFKLRF